ncbi:glutathione S-transferase [Labrenzia sp. EL_195]|uniref:glutathione S-transferase family protein n=1 Tax=Roseibium album TaxID=311410 RepID=UPI000D54CDAE|nr:glutathione S-transferase family protein [Roseibium album]MBG6160742.1 glutathione S-transferase [Labrenzia sp. EL_195]
MEPTIYTISGSPRGWRVLLGMVIKGLDMKVRYLSLSDDEHKSDSYLEINPRGRVPSLVAGDVVITDSLAILSWLDQQFSELPLFGSSPEEHARIWSATRDATDKLRDGMNSLLLPIFFKGAETANPDLHEAADTVMYELQWLESRLDGQDFMAGDTPTAADAVTYPEIRILARALETHPNLMTELGFVDLDQKFPKGHAWARRIEGLDGFEKSLPVHWSN